MRLETSQAREQAELIKIRALVDAAMAFAKTLDLKRSPNAHITKALDQENLRGEDRSYFRRKIVAELKRRGFKTPQEQLRDQKQAIEEARRDLLLRDAYAHEAQIDPHERDDEDDDDHQFEDDLQHQAAK